LHESLLALPRAQGEQIDVAEHGERLPLSFPQYFERRLALTRRNNSGLRRPR
jgi:hypothetical protein